MSSGSTFHRIFARCVGKSVLCVAASVGFAAGANASDLDSLFKAPPVQPNLTWHGITVIGAIDVAAQYDAVGAPYGGAVFTAGSIILPMSRDPQWLLVPNQSTSSYIGIKVDEPITNDLSFNARLESGFNPTSGQLTDGLKSVQQANGIPLNQQSVNGDGSRAGQILNGEAWAGFDAKTWGALHVGRNVNVSSDMLFAYDPLLSYGFSLLGFIGYLGGQGSAETARLDNSVKYLNTFGSFRTELLYGAPGTSAKNFYQGTLGFVRPNFSVDVLAGHSSDSISISALSGAANVGSPFLGARVYDTDLYAIFGKYVFDIGGRGFQDPSDSRFTLSGGYGRVTFSNPKDGGIAPDHTTIGGYQIGPAFSTNGSPGAGVVNYAYAGGDRLVDVSFIAGKYQYDEHWSAAVGYYRFDQNSFGFGVNNLPGVVAPSYSKTSCSTSAFTNCSGVEQVVSFRVDYDYTRNIKVYAGVAYSKVGGGLAFGYLNLGTFDPTVGVRYTF